MAYADLSSFIKVLEENNELIRIKTFVNPELEIAEIVDRVTKAKNHNNAGKAILFENTGTDYPLLINLFGSDKRICMALSVDNLDEISQRLLNLIQVASKPKAGMLDKIKALPLLKEVSSWMPSVTSGRGACQEVVEMNPDLNKLPVLKCWPEDGGRFITFPMVITRDPETGVRNVGMYRMQVMSSNSTGMHWHMHKTGARHFAGYKKKGERMPIAVALGGDPVLTYAATAPLPDNIDEFLLAGFIRKKKVKLVKCITSDIEVPAEADIIIEGYIDTSEDLVNEGPFGDHTGFYSLMDKYPLFHVTCITHRKNAVYPATIVGIPPQEDAWIGKATERIFIGPMKLAMLPEIIDMDLPESGVAHNISIVSFKHEFPGHEMKVMNSLWGAGQMMFNKILILAGSKVNIHNYSELIRKISDNVNPATDVVISKGPMDVLDHSSHQFAFGGKLGIYIPEEHEKSDSVTDVTIQELNGLMTDSSQFNQLLILENIKIAVLSIDKTKEKVSDWVERIKANMELWKLKFVIFVDHFVDVNNLYYVAWYCSGNIDPEHDCSVYSYKNGYSSLFIDGTRKVKGMDGFKREWPNVIISSQETISKVDSIWEDLKIGDLIESPSNSFRKMVPNSGAVVKE